MTRSTRIFVSSAPWSLARFIPTVFTELVAHGAELVFAAVPGKDPVPRELNSHPRVSAVELPLLREGPEGEAVKLLRRLSDLNRFLNPELVGASWGRSRTALRALVSAEHPEAEDAAARLAEVRLPPPMHGRVTKLLNGIEQLLPPQPALVDAVAALDVDSALLVSRCSLGGAERDVLKVARTLGMPTTMLVWSWDNLSSKALLNVHPDHLLVWNEQQVEEAVRLHRFPRERVRALGAPNFDNFFEELEKLRGRPHIESERKTILYLGSSKNVCKQEPELFLKWVAAVRAAEDEVVRGARIVVRPYPGGGAWGRWDPAPTEDFVVAPARKLEPALLAGLLTDADAVVALNTSAELEAVLAGPPVVTFRAGELAPGQEGSLHFQYLLEEQGGFVIDSRDLDEHVLNLSRVLRGDVDHARMRAFAERFVRPAGLEQAVAPLVAAAVLELAGPGAPAQPQLAAR